MIVSAFLQFCALHPFLLLGLSIVLMCLIFYKAAKKHLLLSGFALMLPVFGVVNFIWGSEWNAAYVYRHGEKGTGTVIRINPTNTWINNVREVEYVCLIKTKDGETMNAAFFNNASVFYPDPELWMPPQIGEQFDVKYIPGNETNFIILTNDPGSAYSNKINCFKLLQKIASAKAAYEFDPSHAQNKKTYTALIRRYLQSPCDTNMKKAYELILQQTEK
jgi:hypothetical protein